MKQLFLFTVLIAALTISHPTVASSLLTKPGELPEFCPLTWSSKPMLMEPEGEYRALLELISGFWFGENPPLDVDEIKSGLSNAYTVVGGDPDDAPLVIVAFQFLDTSSADKAENRLEMKLDGSPSHKFAKYGEVVIILGHRHPVEDQCATWFWNRIVDEFEGST